LAMGALDGCIFRGIGMVDPKDKRTSNIESSGLRDVGMIPSNPVE